MLPGWQAILVYWCLLRIKHLATIFTFFGFTPVPIGRSAPTLRRGGKVRFDGSNPNKQGVTREKATANRAPETNGRGIGIYHTRYSTANDVSIDVIRFSYIGARTR
jgi:hypothetical protein